MWAATPTLVDFEASSAGQHVPRGPGGPHQQENFIIRSLLGVRTVRLRKTVDSRSIASSSLNHRSPAISTPRSLFDNPPMPASAGEAHPKSCDTHPEPSDRRRSFFAHD